VDAGGSRPLESAYFVKEVLIVQLMQVVAALIEYISLACAPKLDSTSSKTIPDAGKRVEKLYDKYQELEKFAKVFEFDIYLN